MKGTTQALLLFATVAISCVVGYQPSCQTTDLIIYADQNYNGIGNTIGQYLANPNKPFPNTRFGVFGATTFSGFTWSKAEAAILMNNPVASVIDINRLSLLWDAIVANCDPTHKIVVLVGTDSRSWGGSESIPQTLNFIQSMKDNSTYHVQFVVVSNPTFYYDFIGKIASEPTEQNLLLDSTKFSWGLAFALGSMNYTSCTLLGDSRVATFDGASYIFNGLGEYTLVSAGFDVYVRMMPCTGITPGTYSCLQSIAVRDPTTASCVIAINYDRETNTLSPFVSGSIVAPTTQQSLSCGSYSFTFDNEAINNADNTNHISTVGKVIQGGQTIATISAFWGTDIAGVVSVTLNNTYIGATSGLCGIADGCRDNDLHSTNGDYVSPDASAQDIYQQFALSWASQGNYFYYGPNEAPYMKYYSSIASSYVPNLSTLTSTAAATTCGYFADKSQFLYDSCTTSVATGFTGVTNVYTTLLDASCKAYCTSRIYSNFAGFPSYGPNVFVNTQYCAPRCDYGNTIDLHQDYNSTILPPYTLDYSGVGNSALFHAALGGTYTFAYQLYCPNENATSTINIACETTPIANAGADRSVSKTTIGQHVNGVTVWPAIRLWGEATDVNEANLIFSWAFVELPTMPFSNVTVAEPPIDLANDRRAIFYPTYPGTYVLELAVYDGCSIGKDTVAITLTCDSCSEWTLDITSPFADMFLIWNNQPNHFWSEATFGTSVSEATNYNSQYDISINPANYWFSAQYAANSNGYAADIIPVDVNSFRVLFYEPTQDDLVNTTTATSTFNSSSTVINTVAAPLTDNVRVYRWEATRIVYTTTTTTDDVTTRTSLYNTLAAQPHNRCMLTYTGLNSATTSVSVFADYDYDVDRPLETQSSCFGDYTFEKTYASWCHQNSHNQTISLECSRAPIAYLTPCAKSKPYNYLTASFPTFQISARDSVEFDNVADTNANTLTNTLMRYEYISKPANSSLNNYINVACGNFAPGSGNYLATAKAYRGCRQITVTPDYGGDYTIQLTASNGCSKTTTTSTFTVVCDPLSSVIAGANSLLSSTGNTVDLANLYVSNHTVSTSWALVSGQVGGVSFSATQQANKTFTFLRGGAYVFEATSSDGCWKTVASHTVTYTCDATTTLDVLPGTGSTITFPYVSQLLDATGTTSSAGLPLSFSWRVASVPAHSNVVTTPGFTPLYSFTPDVTGVYVIELSVNDGCQVVSRNYSYTAATCPGYFDSTTTSLDLIDQNSVIRTTFPWNGVGTSLSITAQSNNNGLTPTWVLYYSDGVYIYDTTGNTFDVVNALDIAASSHYVGSYTLKFYTYGACSYAEKEISFTITCARVPSVSIPTVTSPTFANGRFSRVSVTPTVTEDPARPFPTYLGSYSWWVIAAPASSVYYPGTTYTMSQSVTNSTTTTQLSTSPELWEVVEQFVTTTTYVTVQREVQLQYNDNGDRRDACFTPDVKGDYTIMFQTDGYCYDTITASTTFTTVCNTSPTITSVSSTVNYKNSYLGWSSQVIAVSASDSDNDDLYYTYSWVSTPVESPNGNSTSLTILGKSSAYFFPDYPGTWVVGITVTDGCSSAYAEYTVEVTCASQPAIGFAQPSQTLIFDGYVPVTFKEFVLTATPGCTYGVSDYNGNSMKLVDFVPSYVPPPPPPTTGETAGASSVVASLALVIALIALMF